MTTAHETAAEELLDDYLSDPERAAAMARLRAGLRSGRYDERFISRIGQTQRRAQHWPLHQVAAFTHVVSGLASGVFAKRRIKVGETPGPDADRAGNAARLLGVDKPFRARLDMGQNGADSDGSLSWDRPVTLWRAIGVPVYGAHVLHRAIHAPFDVSSYSVPLEVGYTHPSRTLAHLTVEGAVARWSYGDDEICLIVNLERLGPFLAVRALPSDVVPAGIAL